MRTSNQLTSIMLLAMAMAPLGLACGEKATTGTSSSTNGGGNGPGAVTTPGGANPGGPGSPGSSPAGGPAPTPPAQPPSPTPTPGSPPTGPVAVKSCAEVDCPQLFVETINMCDEGRDTMCGIHVTFADPMTPKAFVECFANGVKKRWTVDDDRRQTWTVTKPDGAACYTLEVIPLAGDEDAWVFKSPTGEELGRAVRGKDGLFLTCSANDKVYDVTGLDCPGLVLGHRCRADATCN
jgi:hypothetical protein